MYISNVSWHLKIKQGCPKNPITNIFKKFTKKKKLGLLEIATSEIRAELQAMI